MDIRFTGPESKGLRVEEQEELSTYFSKDVEGVFGKHGLCCRRVCVRLSHAGIG